MIRGKQILIEEEEFMQLNADIDSKTEDLLYQIHQIKEMQSNNEKLYAEWCSKDGEENGPETSENVTKEIKTQDTLSEKTFIEKGNSSSIEEEDSLIFLKLLESNSQLKEMNLGKESYRRNLKGSVSGRINSPGESFPSMGVSRYKSDGRIKSSKIDIELIPENIRAAGLGGILKFLSTKIRLLSEQLQVMLLTEKKHLDKIKELQTQKDKSVEEREKLLLQNNVSRNTIIKYERQLSAQIQSSQNENFQLKKELECLKRELRQNLKNSSIKEIKLNKTLEEVEKLKFIIQQMRQDDKEFKEIQKKKTEDLTSTVKSLDRQRTELLHGFKKQLLVIENMKKQKEMLDAAKYLKFTEDDILGFLSSTSAELIREDSVKFSH